MGKTVTKNRRAFRNYDFEEFYEAGIELEGTEVKALRENRGHLKDSAKEYKPVGHVENAASLIIVVQ